MAASLSAAPTNSKNSRSLAVIVQFYTASGVAYSCIHGGSRTTSATCGLALTTCLSGAANTLVLPSWGLVGKSSALGRTRARRITRVHPVAGFDFEFRYTPHQQPLLAVCLKAAQSRARRLGISWRNNRGTPGALRCIVDGNGRRLDVLGHALERDLPQVAEGAGHVPMSPQQRRRLGLGFADLYGRGLDVRSDGPWLWRGASQTRYFFAPFAVAWDDAPGNLYARLTVTEGVLVDWYFQRIAPVVLLEELHTACELLLEHLVNPSAKRLSFSELVELADDEGMLSVPPAVLSVSGRSVNRKELLLTLKDYRKNARHRADMSFEPWLNASWEDIAFVIERLAGMRLAPVQDAAP